MVNNINTDQSEFPYTADKIDTTWLNQTFKQAGYLDHDTISACSIEPFGIEGHTSIVYLLSVQYTRPCDHLPEQFVVKMASPKPELRTLFAHSLQYHSEVNFYLSTANDNSINVPKCYFAQINQTNDYFILILEKIVDAVTAEPFQSQVDEIEKVIKQIAAFHAYWWQKEHHLPNHSQLYTKADQHRRINDIQAGIDFARKYHCDVFGEPFLNFMDKMINHFDVFGQLVLASPQTLIHGDFHPQQVLCPADTLQANYIIDWQYCCISTGVTDLSRYIANALFSDVRRQISQQVIDIYYQALLDNGVTNYSFDQLMDDFKLSTFYTVCMHIALLPALDLDAFGANLDMDVDWYDLVFDRQIQMLSEFDLEALLAKRLPKHFG